jgi:hypothetical protein
LEQVSAEIAYAVATINGLEMHDEGSNRLRQKLLAFYGVALTVPLHPAQLRDAPNERLLDDALAEVEEIKERVLMLEVKLRKLKR